MRRVLGLAGAAVLTIGAQAPSPAPGFSQQRTSQPQRACLTTEEARGLVQFILPAVVDGLARQCRGALPSSAYLRSQATGELSDRLRRDGDPSWPVARRAMEKLQGRELPTPLGEGFTKRVAEGTAAEMVLREFDRADCRETSALVGGLAPLPSTNMAEVFAAILVIGARKEPNAPLRICAPTRER